MKALLRSLFINVLVLYLAVLIFPGIIYNGQLETLLLASVTLTLLNNFVKPIIKLLLLPINLITLNLFAWVANVLMLFLVTSIVKGYQVVGFHFSGFIWQGFIIPAMDISQLFSFILASVLISIVVALIRWLLKS
jgi:putative membrane protein